MSALDGRARRARPRRRARRARRPATAARACPARCCCGWTRDAIARLARGLREGSVLVSATNGKTTTAALAASIFDARRDRDRAQRRRREHGGRRRLGAAATATPRAQLGLFEVDEFWLDEVAAALEPRAIVLGNLFRDQLDRYGELETIAERWAALDRRAPDAARAERRRPADRRPRARAPGRALLRHRGRRRGARRRARARVGLEALPQLRRRLRATRTSTSPTSASTPARAAGAARPQPAVSAARDRARRAARRELRAAHAARDAPPRGSRCPGLYNVYNALARRGARERARASRRRRSPRASAATAAVFGRGERVALDGRELAILLIKNPAGANEVLRLLGAQDGAHDVLGVLNDRDRRRPRRLVDLGRRLRDARAARRATPPAPGTRAAELALRLKYAGVPAERITRDRGPRRRRSTARSARRRPASSTRCPPTPRCSRCASCSRAAGRRASSWARA